MAIQAKKDPKVGQLRAQAQELRDKLANPDVVMSKDEVEKAGQDIAALEARAAMIAGFTPQAEIDDQGGDAELRRANPDSQDASAETLDFQGEIETLAKEARKVFGGPNRYLMRVAQRSGNAYTFSPAEERVHKALQSLHKRAIIGDTGDVSGGEYLLPLQQVQSIFQVANEQMGIVQNALRFPVSGRTLRIPYAVQDQLKDKDGNLISRPLAGIANVSIIGEGDLKPTKQPSFGQRLLTVYKVAAYTELGDEILGDDFTGDLAPTVQRMVGGQTLNFINELTTIDGTGTSEPLGALNSGNGALLSVERETLDTITSDDVFNMFAQHTFGGGQSFWLIHRTALPKLLALKISGNTLVTFVKSFQDAPSMSLLGLPVYITDLTAVLGSTGDLALVNGGFYALAIRQALTVESSIHYKFANDLTAYRFVSRAGGIPIPTSTYAYKAQGETHTGAKHPAAKIGAHSPFVVLSHAAIGS